MIPFFHDSIMLKYDFYSKSGWKTTALYGCGMVIIMVFLSSCTQEFISVEKERIGKEYFPVEPGMSWIYEYDSTVYDKISGNIIHSSGLLLEEIVEKLDEDRYMLRRSIRKEHDVSWKVTDIWSVRREDERAVKVENNLPFIKLVFPPLLNATWNGNALFKDDITIQVGGELLQPYLMWQYKIVETNGTFQYNDTVIQEIIKVEQVDQESLIDFRYSEERYAKGIGLVEKFMLILDCQCIGVSQSIPWEDKAEKGFILRQKLIDHY